MSLLRLSLGVFYTQLRSKIVVMLHAPSRDLVLKKIRTLFPIAANARQAMAILDTYGAEAWHREKDRVHLAVLKLGGDDLASLRRCVEVAKRDFRDVLAPAEYPEQMQAGMGRGSKEMEVRDLQQYRAWLNSEGI